MGNYQDPGIGELWARLEALEKRLAELAKQSAAAPPAAKYMDVSNAARMLGIGRSSLYNLMREGRLSYVVVGRQRRLLVSDLEKYAEGHYVPARPSIL